MTGPFKHLLANPDGPEAADLLDEVKAAGRDALRELDCLAACIYHEDQRAEVQAFADKFRAALAKLSDQPPVKEK